MKKRLLVLLLPLSISARAYAQQPAAPESAVSGVAPTNSRADTVEAVHSLFSSRRTGGWIWTTIGAILAVRITTAAASGDSGGNAAGAALGVGVVGGVPAGIGVGKLVRFSPEREAAALSTYGQSKQLPKYVRRRLKRKYFHQ
ncbi:MAG: hypothetical protein H7Z21_00855 [Hymenobacter sp.]|nr:hypothetical protein [Hymenobacter sp.]